MIGQPEALRLADELEGYYLEEELASYLVIQAAAELRLLHEQNERLKTELVRQVRYTQTVFDKGILVISKTTGESK